MLDNLIGAPPRPYTLGEGESALSVAEKFGVSHDELRQLNQFRTFTRGFDNIGPSDEVDVPLNKTGNAKETSASADEQTQQLASLASQAGTFLSNSPDSEAARSMVTGIATAKANQEIQDCDGSRWQNYRKRAGLAGHPAGLPSGNVQHLCHRRCGV